MLIYTFSIIGVQFIPSSLIKDNLVSSSLVLKSEGDYPIYGWNEYHRLDLFTDAIIMDIAYTANPQDPVSSGMLNYLHNFNGHLPTDAFYIAINEPSNEIGVWSYSRYWHGHQTLVRPLLIFTDYIGIRVINIIFMASLLLILSFLLWRSISLAYSICIVLSFFMINGFILPFCIQYCACFNVAMIGMIALLLYPNKVNTLLKAGLFFFVIGSICNFFDLLTIPLITLGLPFIVYFSKQKPKHPIKVLLIMGFCWSVGYSLTFVSKWTIATALTGEDCFSNAIEQVKYRVSSSNDNLNFSLLYAVKEIIHCFLYSLNKWFGLGFSLGLIVIHTIFFFFRKKEYKKIFLEYYWLLIVAALVPVWYIFVRNHSFVHMRIFTWRALFLAYYSILLFTYFVVSKTSSVWKVNKWRVRLKKKV